MMWLWRKTKETPAPVQWGYGIQRPRVQTIKTVVIENGRCIEKGRFRVKAESRPIKDPQSTFFRVETYGGNEHEQAQDNARFVGKEPQV